MLWLALAARDSGSRPSALLGVANPTSALSLDIACSLRLLEFDNEREQERFRVLAAMLGAEMNRQNGPGDGGNVVTV